MRFVVMSLMEVVTVMVSCSPMVTGTGAKCAVFWRRFVLIFAVEQGLTRAVVDDSSVCYV